MNIYEKINLIMQDIEYLQKDDRVDTGNGKGYKAITEEKVTNAVRQSLIKNKVVIIPIEQIHRREDEEITDSYGKKKINRLTTVDVTYRIQDVEDINNFVIAVSSGTGVDTQDKGVGKAMTYAYKYLLLRMLAIPTGEDSDKVSSDLYTQQLNGKVTEENKDVAIDNIKQITDIQVGALKGMLQGKTDEDTKKNVDRMLKKCGNGKGCLEELNGVEYVNMVKYINEKKEKQKEAMKGAI